MNEKDKMTGADFVNDMADLGEAHSKLIYEVLEKVAQEVEEKVNNDAIKNIHPIFVSAGRGAYHGALNIMMKKSSPIFDIINPK